MGYLKTVEGLTEEQCKTYQSSIRRGYFRGYDKMWRTKSFTNAFLWKHPNRFTIIDTFNDVCGHDPEWSDITDMNLMLLAEALDESKAANTVKTLMAQVNALIKDYESFVLIPSKNHDRICCRKSDVSQSVYLNIDELRNLILCPCNTPLEASVLRIFFIECFTGARWGDAQNIDETNFNAETNTIRYYSTKNRRDIVVPCHAYLRGYLAKTDEILPYKHIRLSQYNTTIRTLCQRACINGKVKLHRRSTDVEGEKWEFISSHTGRRSFATNLYLKGVPVDTICQLMGHSSPKITMNYIKDKRPLDDTVMNAFREDA